MGACGSQAGRGPCLSETTWRAALGGGVEISRRHEEAGANQRSGHGTSVWSRPWAQRGRGHGGGHVRGLGDCPMWARHWAETRCDLTLRMPHPTAATPRLCIPVTPSRVPRSLRSPPQTTGFDLSSEPLKAQTPRLRLSPPSRDPAAKSSKDLSAGHWDPASRTLAPGTPPHPAPAACCVSTSPTPHRPHGPLCPAAVEAPSSAPQVNTVICPGGSASRQEQLLGLSALHPSRAQAQAHTCMHTHTCVHARTTCTCMCALHTCARAHV